MNELHVTNNHGLRLIQQFEGAPRLAARECEGGRWELGWGCTFHTDNTPVEPGETCTPEYANVLFRHALKEFEAIVRRHVTVDLNSNQFSALVALAYNIGEDNFATGPYGHCTALKETNARRFYDAAEAFGRFVYATKGGHKQALRGLLRRHYAEACLYMGYDWVEATDDDAIALQREQPPLINGRRTGTDKVLYKTPWSEVLRVAQKHPLPAIPVTHGAQEANAATQPAPAMQISPQDSAGGAGELVLENPIEPSVGPQVAPGAQPDAGAESLGKPTQPTSGSAAPLSPSQHPNPAPSVESSRVGAGEKQAAGSGVPAGSRPADPVGTKPIHPDTKMPEHVPYRIDPHAGLKPMESTERFVGAAFMFFGTIMRVGMANGMKVSGVGGVLVVAVLDMMKSPTNLAVLISAVAIGVTAVGWGTGYCMDRWGLKKKKRGERTSTQGMY